MAIWVTNFQTKGFSYLLVLFFISIVYLHKLESFPLDLNKFAEFSHLLV